MRVASLLLSVLTVAVLVLPPAFAQTPPRPRLTGISHVGFRVTDGASARRFYGDLVGLTERAVSPGGRIAYAVGHRQHVLLEPGLPAGDDERLSHVAFETPDVQGLAAYLTSRGVQILRAPDRCQDTAIRVVDPDGHAIEFVQVDWPPAPAPIRPESATAGPGRALSSHLLHAGLTVRDEQSAHRFYRDTLGFAEIWRGGRTEGTTDWVNMRVPDGTEYLEYMMIASAPDRRRRGVLHHVCLRVPDIQAAWEAVATRTPPSMRSLLSAPNVGTNGRWQLNLYDPDGTRTELMEPFTIR